MRSSHMKYWLSLAVSVAAICCMLSSTPALAMAFHYTAITQASKAARQGMVRTGSLSWLCTGNRCSISGPWPTPGVGACHLLALQVGRLRSYGHTKMHLNAGQMVQCNAGITLATAKQSGMSLQKKNAKPLLFGKPANSMMVMKPASSPKSQKSKAVKPKTSVLHGLGASATSIAGQKQKSKSAGPTTSIAKRLPTMSLKTVNAKPGLKSPLAITPGKVNQGGPQPEPPTRPRGFAPGKNGLAGTSKHVGHSGFSPPAPLTSIAGHGQKSKTASTSIKLPRGGFAPQITLVNPKISSSLKNHALHRPISTKGGLVANTTVSVPAASVRMFVAETVAPAKVQGQRTSSSLPYANGWICHGNRCTHLADGSTRFSTGLSNANPDIQKNVICFNLARVVGRLRSFSGPNFSLSPQQVANCNKPMLHAFAVTTRSGEDGLREGSQLSMEVLHQSVPLFRPALLFTNIPSHDQKSTYAVVDNFLGQAIDITKEETIIHAGTVGFERLRFKFKSGQRNIFDTADKWDMTELSVRAEYIDLDGGMHEVTLINGGHVHTFHDGDEWDIDTPNAMPN